MNKPIYERIELEVNKEIELLTKSAQAEASALLKVGKEAIINDNNEKIAARQSSAKARVSNFQERSERNLITYSEQAKQQFVVNLFTSVLRKLQALKGADLLHFVSYLIKEEQLSGREVMHVSSQNFTKYVNALSSKKDANYLDLLNAKAKGYALTLSEEPVHLNEGFLLSGAKYDLIFDFKEIVEEYQAKHEQKVYKELFSEK